MLSRLGILVHMGIQNILLHRIKSLVVGGILFFGSLILCTGLNLTRSVESAMAESIQGSIGGDFQVYDSLAKDPLALFGGAFFGREELGLVPSWPQAAAALEEVDGVRAVVPMGFGNAFIGRGNDFDNLFEKLRDSALSFGEASQEDDPTLTERLSSALREHISLIRANLAILRRDLETERAITSDPSFVDAQIADLEPVLEDGFWNDLIQNARSQPPELENQLLYLDARVAPIGGEKPPVYLRYMGTDIERFTQSFSRFELLEGELPSPNDTRWILLPKRFYERELKNLVAVDLDKLDEGVRLQGLDPETDPQMTAILAQLPEQYLDLVYALAPSERLSLRDTLLSTFPFDKELPFEELIKSFLTIKPSYVLSRTRFFQESIAPRAKLYDAQVGETLYVRAYTRTGFLETVPLRVAGIYTFQGLDRSEVAGAISITSLESFRELYGVMSKQGRKELEELTASIDVSGERFATTSASLEDALFGSAEPAGTADAKTGTEGTQATPSETAKIAASPETDVDEIALNLAVIAKDRSAARDLGTSLKNKIQASSIRLQVVDWKEASGIIGQMVTALNAILFISVFIILVVGVAIINNSLMMSTLERTREIGTLRAIGATKRFVTSLFLVEIIVLASVAVYAGALASLLINLWLNNVGIPAPNDFTVFLFSGPRLYPMLRPEETLLAASVLLAIAVLSSAFPARFASRIEPAVAMQEKE